MAIKMYIKTITEKILTFDVAASVTIATLKTKINQEEGIPYDHKLFFGDMEMDDRNTLASYGIKTMSTLTVKMSRPLLYDELGKVVDFREFIRDLLLRMGLADEHLDLLFSKENRDINYNEFAKCFITRSANPMYNYEMYELTGDTCLNKAVVMYFFKVLQSVQERKRVREEQSGRVFRPDIRLVDYFNKLKAMYISTKVFSDIARRLGFKVFIQMGPRDVHEEIDSILEDSFEAFFGCFEILVDRYIQPHYSHHYVSNYVSYLFGSRRINYHPVNLYDSITLLKETNDLTIRGFTNPSTGVFTPGYKHEVFYDDRDTKSLIAYHINDAKKRTRIYEIMPIEGKSKQSQVIMAERVLEYLKRHPEWFATQQIRLIPKPEELGIEELCK
jgi:hypothetical protein